MEGSFPFPQLPRTEIGETTGGSEVTLLGTRTKEKVGSFRSKISSEVKLAPQVMDVTSYTCRITGRMIFSWSKSGMAAGKSMSL